MPILLKDPNQINAETLAFLQANTQVSNVAKGTIVQTITGAVNTVLAQAYDDLSSSLAETYLSTASGSSLDFIGAMLGLPRGGSILATKSNVQQFYVLSGNFGSLPGIGTLNNTIPAGTLVQSQDGTIQYQTVGSTHFNDSDTQVFATVKSMAPGAASNVGTNILTKHSLSIAGLLTTNISPIDNGSDTQTDSQYRFALSQAVTAAEAANEISVRLAALSVQGVSDVRIIPYFYGVGTYSVVVVGMTPVVDDATLASVLNLVRQVTALGELVTVRAPRYVGVEVTAKLIFSPSTPDNLKPSIINSVKDTLFDYFNNIPLGQGLIRDQVLNRILNVDSQILDVDDDPTSPTNMQIAIWTPTLINFDGNGNPITNRVREVLPKDYTAFFDDKLLAEVNVQGFVHATGFNAINITQ